MKYEPFTLKPLTPWEVAKIHLHIWLIIGLAAFIIGLLVTGLLGWLSKGL